MKHLTKKELEKLKERLKHLETTKRKEVADMLNHAISFGDLSENAAYDDARNEKVALEKEIFELKELISKVKVIEKEKTEAVQIGSKVTIADDGGEFEVEIVGMLQGKKKGEISSESPIGKAVLGKKAGDIVEIETPSGKAKYKIIKVDNE